MAFPAGSLDRLIAKRLAITVVVTPFIVLLGCGVLLHGTWIFQGGDLNTLQRSLLKDYALASGIVLFASLLCSVPLGWLGSRMLLRPLREFREAVEAAHRRTDDKRIELGDTQDDIAAIGIVLNQTFERVESLSAQAHTLTEASAREIKESLTDMQQIVERLRPAASAKREAVTAISDLSAAIGRLQRMIDGVLFLAKADSGTLLVNLKPTDLSALVDELVRDAANLAAQHGVRVVAAKSAGGVQVVDEVLLRQLFLNLLSNALAVSPRESTITVECFAGNGRWQLVMTDEGPGLPVDQHYRVFEPFVRHRHSDVSTAPAGAGLGLTLCERIATLHGGTIRARNHSSGRGLRVTVAVPIQS